MRSIDPDMPITVLSKDPRSTRLTYRVRAVHRSNFLAWHTAMWNSRLYINGGRQPDPGYTQPDGSRLSYRSQATLDYHFLLTMSA